MIQKESKAWLKVAQFVSKRPIYDEGFLCYAVGAIAGTRPWVRSGPALITTEMAGKMKNRIREALGVLPGVTLGAYDADSDPIMEDREARVTTALLFAAQAADEEAAA